MRKWFFIVVMLDCLNGFSQPFKNLSFRVGYSQSAQMKEATSIQNITYWRNNIHSAYFGLEYAGAFSKKWGYSIGVQMCEKGYKTKYQNIAANGAITFDVSYQFTLNYIDIPINTYFGGKKYQFKIGVIPSFLVGNNFRFVQTEKTPYTYMSYKYATTNPDRFKKFDFGLNLGLVKKVNQHFDIEFNAQRHFIKPDKWGKAEINYHQTFLLGIKYYFVRNVMYFQEKKKIQVQ